MTHSVNKITILNGSSIEGYPITSPKEREHFTGISIDTTGEYIQTGTKHIACLCSELQGKRSQIHKQFYEHVNLFLANKERILSDSRMFLTPVYIDNAMSVTGRSGFQNATLGVYLEWWLHHTDASIDRNGNPIWYISGSPLSGSHACSSVDREGRKYDACLKGRFRDVWESFMEVNKRYSDVKDKYQAYNLKEVIEMLTTA